MITIIDRSIIDALSCPMASSRSCSARRVSLSIGRLANSSIRRRSMKNASRNARRLSASDAVTAAGSGTPQCAVIGWPGQKGHVSAAAWSHTVKTKCSGGASASANSFQLLLRSPSVGDVMLLQDLEREGIDGALRMTSCAERPKLTPGDAGMIGERLRHDRPRRVAGAEEQDVQHVYLDSASRGKRSGLSVKSASTPRLPR